MSVKRIIVLFVLGVSLLSCQNEDNAPLELACGVSDPVKDLNWLEEKAEELASGSLSEYFYIAQTERNGESLFIFGNCCPNCNSVAPVYNCSGEELGFLGGEDGEFSTSLLEDSQIIWKAEDNSCQLTDS